MIDMKVNRRTKGYFKGIKELNLDLMGSILFQGIGLFFLMDYVLNAPYYLELWWFIQAKFYDFIEWWKRL